MDNQKKKIFELPKNTSSQQSIGGAIFNPPTRQKAPPSPDVGFAGLDGSTFKPDIPTTPTGNTTTSKNTPQTISQMIAGSASPELELQKYLYETGLENVFTDYQKNIASLDKSRQQDIADAYFVREMSKKYLGEYASNAGIGDVSGNLIDIYGKYAENLAYIGQNYETLKTSMESQKTASERAISEKLLQTEVGLDLAEYQDTLLQAQSSLPSMIMSGDYGGFASVEEYVNSLNLPERYKNDLINWANQEKDYYESTSFVSVKGMGMNQTELDRFGLTAQPNLDLNFFSNEKLLSDYAFVRNGNYYGVMEEPTDLPTSALENFNYQVGGMLVYKGETYMYMGNDEFHKVKQVDMEGAKIPRKNGLVEGDNYNVINKGVMYNGVNYTTNKQIKDYDSAMLEAFGLYKDSDGKLTALKSTDKEWQMAFYDGQYYLVNYGSDGTKIKIYSLKKKAG